MAIGAQDLTITITEDFGTNQTGVSGGTTATNLNTSIAEVLSVSDVYARIISVPTSEITLYNTHGSIPQGSTFDNNAVSYVRITNHDADGGNYIHLRISNMEGDEFVYKLIAGKSFLLWGQVGVMNASQAVALTLGTGESSIADVTAQANTAAVDVEVVICS